MITQDKVKDLFSYDNGCLYWNEDTAARAMAGSSAGFLNKSTGRKYVGIGGKHHFLHRIIFLYHNGYMPNFIDHIDGNPLNNKIENLRVCSQRENSQNAKLSKSNVSGVKGVCWVKRDKRWLAKLQIKGKNKYLGHFSNILDA